MLHLSDDVGVLTERYMLAHGERATAHIGDDISRAIGCRLWSKAHLLERVKLRLLRINALRCRRSFGRKRMTGS